MEQNCSLINGTLVHLCEYIKDRLYFVTLPSKREPKSTPDSHYFCVDDELVYSNYYSDFGPLNLGMVYRYCVKVNTKLKCFSLGKKKVIHYTTSNPQKRSNAAFLIASYAIIYLNMTPREAYRPLLSEKGQAFKPFQDASIGASPYQIRLLDVLDGVYRALQYGFFNFQDFDLDEYERYETLEYGDLNWIIPNKFLAFCGPTSEENSTYKKPENYVKYFKRNSVSTVIRLNKKSYNSRSFTDAGIDHYDLYFIDGSVPSQALAQKFLEICENAKGAVAVHCKAGLGRTGSLIAAYMMKHYRMTAQEAIAWLRVCRPGSVIGRQQIWLEEVECWLWRSGECYRVHHHGDGDKIPHHFNGIYSLEAKHEKGHLPPQLYVDSISTRGTNYADLSAGSCLKHLLGEHVAVSQASTAGAASTKKSQSISKKTKASENITPIRVGTCQEENACNADALLGRMATVNVGMRNCAPVTARFLPLSYNLKRKNTYATTNMAAVVNNNNRREQYTQGDHLNLIKGLKARLPTGRTILSKEIPRK